MIRRLLLRALVVLRRCWRRVWRGNLPPLLDPYRGYAVPGGMVLRARVLTALRRTAPDPEDSRWRNLRQMASLFLTDEVAGVTVRAVESGITARSDVEGYATFEVPADLPAGWHDVEVEVVGVEDSRTACPVLIPDADARLGVISDIDDTVMETGAYSLVRNLWTTFTGSTLTRRVYPDSVVLMDHLSARGRNPVFYVSSSPWNLHAFLDKVFARSGLMPGPMFLRDLGLTKRPNEKRGHGGHKGAAIDRIMEANPGLSFVLVGDTGQHDANIYLDACHRHGGRVKAVVLREPGRGPDDRSRAAMSAIGRMGVVVAHGPDFGDVPAQLRRAGVEP